jgi:hypothetical protein
MKKTFILDTVSLINLVERCSSINLIETGSSAEFQFHVVLEVKSEFLNKPTELGVQHLQRYLKNNLITIIDFDQAEVDITVLRKLEGLDLGEKISLLYWLQNKEFQFLSDDRAVHEILNREFGLKCQWTTNFLQELIYEHKISYEDAYKIYHEMKRNGFWGIHDVNFKEEK